MYTEKSLGKSIDKWKLYKQVRLESSIPVNFRAKFPPTLMNFIRSLRCVDKSMAKIVCSIIDWRTVTNCVHKDNVRSRSCTSRRGSSSYCNAISFYQYICILTVHVVGIGALLCEIVAEGRVSLLRVWKEAPNQGGSVPTARRKHAWFTAHNWPQQFSTYTLLYGYLLRCVSTVKHGVY